MPIQIGKAAGAGGGLDALDHFCGPRFFLNLFVDEPLHQHLAGIILRGERRFIDGVDAFGVGLLHAERVLGGIEKGFEILFRRGNGGQFRHDAAIVQVLGNLLRVRQFFGRLFGEVGGKALEVQVRAPERQPAIAVRGTQFVVHLTVQLGDDFGGHFGLLHKRGSFAAFMHKRHAGRKRSLAGQYKSTVSHLGQVLNRWPR